MELTLCSWNITAPLMLVSSSLGLNPRFHCDARRSCDWLFCFLCVATHSSLGFSEFPAFRYIKTTVGISPLCIWALSSWKGCPGPRGTQVQLTASEVQMMGLGMDQQVEHCPGKPEHPLQLIPRTATKISQHRCFCRAVALRSPVFAL